MSVLAELLKKAPQSVKDKYKIKIREKAIGGGSLNLPKISYDAQGNGVVTSVNLPMSFVDTKSINTIDQAVRRTRSGGASVPKKFSINKNA